MIQDAKIQLSADELELMQNSAVILTKNSIIDKVSKGLHALGSRLSMELLQFSGTLPAETFQHGFKVSRGEKYKGLPYLVLDYPRLFGREDIFAIRILFWWGNYYSVTLHCRGKYAGLVKEKLLSASSPETKRMHISCSGDEWNHDLFTDDYFVWDPAIQSSLHAPLLSGDFVKVSLRTPLSQWDVAEERLYVQYHQLLNLIKR